MSENDVENISEENEIVVYDEKNNDNNEENEKTPDKNENINQIQRKPINKLTDEERQIIINNARNGIDQQFYNVKLFKNGETRITLKKDKPKTVTQKVINNNNDESKKVYYSDNQLLMEHIIELTSKYEKVINKQKKLKKKVKSIKHDLYVDIDDSPNERYNENNVEENVNVKNNDNVSSTYSRQEPPKQQVIQQPRNIRNWRTNIHYL